MKERIAQMLNEGVKFAAKHSDWNPKAIDIIEIVNSEQPVGLYGSIKETGESQWKMFSFGKRYNVWFIGGSFKCEDAKDE